MVIHIILGAIFYWRYAIVSRENGKLELQNAELLEYQKKTYQLWGLYYELERGYEKIKNALGIKRPFDASKFSHSKNVESKRPLENFLGVGIGGGGNDNISENQQLNDKFDVMTPKETQYHDYARRMPTLLPVNGYLSQDYRTMKWFSPADYKGHLGIDIVARRGTPVKAAGDGVVIIANWTFDMGNFIIIYHGSGFFTYYGHNDRLLVTEQSFVHKGEVIALLGSSGNSTDPHLHFEVWRKGEPIDPKEVILSFMRM